MSQDESPLLVRPSKQYGEYIRINPAAAGWQYLSFGARRMKSGESWEFDTGENEMAIVLLGGVCSARSSRGEWERIGRRPNVFQGMPYALYLPIRTRCSLTAVSEQVDIAYGWCPASNSYPPILITPEQVSIEIRGGSNATRQINVIIPPGFNCERLVVVEVYTPSGNWSSYPPHKHDRHTMDTGGNLIEADLEEVYFYKIDRPEGYAIQQVYTQDRRLNEIVVVKDSDLVLVPEGYHPVVSAHGYTTYYLNMLAGSAHSLANSDDPDFAWIKDTWTTKDPRLPIVSMQMET